MTTTIYDIQAEREEQILKAIEESDHETLFAIAHYTEDEEEAAELRQQAEIARSQSVVTTPQYFTSEAQFLW